MKKILLIAGIVTISSLARAQSTVAKDSVKLVLDSSIALLKKFALHSSEVNWTQVTKVAYSKAGNAKNWVDLGPAVDYLFKTVNDHHGWLSVGDTDLRWNVKTLTTFSEAIKTEIGKGNRIIKKMLTGTIGYLRVPGMMVDTGMYNKMAQRLADSLFSLEKSGAVKIIIDLRLNAGGTMFPMIAGVSPLLGDGQFLGGKDHSGKVIMDSLVDGKFYSEEGGIALIHNNCRLLNAATPVVILLSNLTGSAGECTAVAFKGRRNTQFVGEPTAGFTTGNNGHWIIENRAGIVIAESILLDRSKKTYPLNVEPDELIPGADNFDNYLQDKKIIAAINWLNKQK